MNSEFVSNLIKFNSQTNGRDKLCRLFQYGCRLAWGQLERGDHKDLIQVMKNIEYAFSMTRKLLRFGKSLDFIQGAMKSIHLSDIVLRITLTLSKINQACYLLFDHFLWFNNVGAVKLDKQYWSEVSARFYLATLILNTVRDVYDIYCLVIKELKSRATNSQGSSYKNGDSNHEDVVRHQPSIVEVLQSNAPLVLDSVKNLFDLAIPMSTLGMLKLSPRQQGMLGVVSSYLGVVTVWNPKLRLVPS